MHAGDQAHLSATGKESFTNLEIQIRSDKDEVVYNNCEV